jgi:ComF family protein
MFQIIKKIYGWFLPATCILCHYPSHQPQDLCQRCLHELPILPQSCHRCANILASPAATCGACLKRPPVADAMHVLFSYQTPITKLIMELKFHENLVNAKLLGELMTTAILQRWYCNKPLPALIIPIPLHHQRMRERGFNQALEISRPIANTLKIPIASQSCFRIKNTAAQARQHAQNRRRNMRGAFQINRAFNGLHVAVLDDVITTGSTLLEFTKTLRGAGASRIDIWCCAKTLLK